MAFHAQRIPTGKRAWPDPSSFRWLEPDRGREPLFVVRHDALIAVASRSGFGQRLKRLGIQNNNGPVFEANPVAGSPNPQLLVDAFPGHANHFAEFLLGNGDRSALRNEFLLSGQANQRTGEPAGQILKNKLLDLVAGPPQLRAKQLDEFHRQRRMVSYKRKKFAAIYNKNLAVRICGSVGCPRVPIEHRDFTEDFTGADKIKNRAAAIGRGDAHFHGAADDGNKTVSGVSFGTDRRAPLQRGMLGVAAELIEGLRFKVTKIGMLAQHCELVARKPASFACLVLGHAGHDHLVLCVVHH